MKNQTAFEQQTAGVVDTILNRVMSEKWGRSVRSVVNAHRQFSKITGPASLKPYGSVQNMPWSHVKTRTKKYVLKYLVERANGKGSIIEQHLHYANKYYSDSKNRKAWVDAFHDEAVRNGLILGVGKSIHAHGTQSSFVKFKPEPFDIQLPSDFVEIR